eukprot:Blabericola_migrator_1__5157@NODE_265_length_10621_cov_160_318363_g221_i0_p2_GENE_NODE_265_length_10621_cov_160_318363_g221_i0NODE_265_length_10621_cov_160_318363_g221_i0_p2_ORF_typecomplete_len469_score71_03CBS/PF00571_28/1_2e03CBS/PF00571_28/1_8e04CBS/PF00571_28/0_0047CBS/PF00571_28/1_8e07Mob_synth_C/PF06463_13/2_4e02Mob_synth_C/PF06463_13/1_3_NODE_265_length_10621_cov_160_318363_g221_i014892895
MFNVYGNGGGGLQNTSSTVVRSLAINNTSAKASTSVRPVFQWSSASPRRQPLTIRLTPNCTMLDPIHNILSKPFADSATKFLPHQETICIPGDANIKNCLQAMDKAHLRSCMICLGRDNCVPSSPRMGVPCCMEVRLPQQDKRPSDEVVKEHFKMLDMRDILRSLVERGQDLFEKLDIPRDGRSRTQSSADGELDPTLSDHGEVDEVTLARRNASDDECTKIVTAILEEPSGAIANISQKNTFKPCWIDDTLNHLIHAFEVSPRVPLFEWDPAARKLRLIRIFSATDLFSLFNNTDFITQMDKASNEIFSTMLDQPVGSIWDQRSGTEAKLQVCADVDPLLDTMRKLSETGYTALPIVDSMSPRKTLGVISVRDFKLMLTKTEKLASILSLSTLTYVSQVRQLECLKAKFPSISVHQKTPLRTVVHKMLAADIQRIFIVDEQSQIVGIFSRTDLGRLIAKTINTQLNS